jgi:hypothetical protein
MIPYIPYAVSIKFMLAGYSAIFLILAAYLASLILRWKRNRRELKILEDISDRVQKGNQ